jgi:ABC-type nitrate/sulfonate/bicarbonate transport system substrate-binding protein
MGTHVQSLLRAGARLRRTSARRSRADCQSKGQTISGSASVCALAAAAIVWVGSVSADSWEQRSWPAVRIGGATYLGDLPTHVADNNRLFAEESLRADVQYSESGRHNLARLRAGETDFALMALTPLVLDRLADRDPGQPEDPVILASLLQSYELTAVLARPGTGIERPADLAGRRVGLERGTNTEFVWWLFEQVHRIDPASVRTVSVPFSRAAAALLGSRVDAVVLPEPWASELETRYQQLEDRQPVRFDTHNLYAGRWIIVTTRRHLHERYDTCRRVLSAYRQATEWIERSPQDAISIYAGSTAGSRRNLADRWQALDYDINLDWALVSSLQEQFHWARDRRIEHEADPIHVLDLIEPGPLQQISPAAVKIPEAAVQQRVP